MKNKPLKLLIVVIVLQIAIFSSMIVYSVRFNSEIQKEAEYTMLIDLNYMQNNEVHFSTRTNDNVILSWYLRSENQYAILGVDENGYAIVTKVVDDKPENQAYIKIDKESVKKFRSYEITETERAYYPFNNAELENPYIKFKVKNGKVLVTELGIAGIPIEEWLKEPVTKETEIIEDEILLSEDEMVW